jgi:hypothetical protein
MMHCLQQVDLNHSQLRQVDQIHCRIRLASLQLLGTIFSNLGLGSRYILELCV